MVTLLGWERRRHYEELFDGLERLQKFRDGNAFQYYHQNIPEALQAVRDVSWLFELLRAQTPSSREESGRRQGRGRKSPAG
jgi:hypothetical protein